ncbi:MAG: site-2 protease family protein, partial [Candidatus Omnitrophica bacterium]|nr:site-2 protease family protein [Candidatus Omnitrophota bacterium]
MIATFCVFLTVLSILIVVHEWGHFAVARACGVRVEQFSLGFGPVIARWKRGETEYRLCWILFGGYVKMAGEQPDAPRANQPWEFLSKSVGQRLAIVSAGPGLNYVLAWVAFVAVFLLGNPTLQPVVGELVDKFPAKAAGVRTGDRITAVDGAPVGSWDEVTERVHRRTDGTVALDVTRDRATLRLTVPIQVRDRRDLFGRHRQVGLIGIAPSGEVREQRYGFVESLGLATEKVWSLTVLTFEALGAILFGRLSVQESLTGP